MLRSWFFGDSSTLIPQPTFKASLEKDPNDKRYPWYVRFSLGNQNVQVFLRADIRLGMGDLAIEELTKVVDTLRSKQKVKCVGNVDCFFRPVFDIEETDLGLVFYSNSDNRAHETFRVVYGPIQVVGIINEIESVMQQISEQFI